MSRECDACLDVLRPGKVSVVQLDVEGRTSGGLEIVTCGPRRLCQWCARCLKKKPGHIRNAIGEADRIRETS